MKPELKLFGTDGIRAVAGSEPLTPGTIEKIAESAAQVLKARGPASRRVLIGKDTRESCGWIEAALARGFRKEGLQAYSAGVIPTAAVSALLRAEAFLGGTVVSASHNPSEFNGIKFFSSDGKKIPDGWEAEIEQKLPGARAAEGGEPPQIRSYAEGMETYGRFLKSSVGGSIDLKDFKWVLDCANGSAYVIAPALLESFGASLRKIGCSPDGKNINLACGALFPRKLKEEIAKSGARGGCAFDGDADRAVFVDEDGRVMDGDILIAMAARYLKEKGKLRENMVVATVMANLGFHKEMEKSKIRVLTVPVGDRAVSEALESSGAVLGGEPSGHIIFREYLPTGDGLLTALQILKIVRESGRDLSFFSQMLPKFPQVLLNLRVREKIPIERCPDLKGAIERAESHLKTSGRVLVRYSGTEPLLRIMLEGDSESRIKEIAQNIMDAAKKSLA